MLVMMIRQEIHIPPHFSDINMMRAFSRDMKTRTAWSRLLRFISPWYLVIYTMLASVILGYGGDSLYVGNALLAKIVRDEGQTRCPLRHDQDLENTMK